MMRTDAPRLECNGFVNSIVLEELWTGRSPKAVISNLVICIMNDFPTPANAPKAKSLSNEMTPSNEQWPSKSIQCIKPNHNISMTMKATNAANIDPLITSSTFDAPLFP